MQLSEHFSLEEFLFSETAVRRGIENKLPKHLMAAAQMTCEGLERCRVWTQKPILISSGYRCLELNRALGSSDDSQHVRAEAVDITCPSFGSAYALACCIRDNKTLIKFDQLIYEYRSWVHLSFTMAEPRGMVLTIHSKKEGYVGGILY